MNGIVNTLALHWRNVHPYGALVGGAGIASATPPLLASNVPNGAAR